MHIDNNNNNMDMKGDMTYAEVYNKYRNMMKYNDIFLMTLAKLIPDIKTRYLSEERVVVTGLNVKIKGKHIISKNDSN